MITDAVLLLTYNNAYSSDRPFGVSEWAGPFAGRTCVEQHVRSWLGEFGGCSQSHFPLGEIRVAT